MGRSSFIFLLTAALLAANASGASAAEQDGLVAHWPLEEDTRDAGPHRLETVSRRVAIDAPAGGASQRSARFAERGAHLSVADARLGKLPASEFTMALWLNTDDQPHGGGDLLTCYDFARRAGFQLALRTNTGVTTCQANYRQLQFGIDAGAQPEWRSEGNPSGSSILAFALAVQGGSLYAGTCEPAADAAGRVYRYRGPNAWDDLGAPDKCNAISAMAEYRGKLYVGSSKYRLGGSALPESENPHDGGGIYRLDDGDRWVEVGRLPPEHVAIGGLVVYGDRLYASSLYRPAGLFRYDEDVGRWTPLPTPDGLRVEALGVFDDCLWGTSYDGGYVFRFDGRQWKTYGPLADNTQTYSFAVHRGRLHVGTWPSGRVFRLGEDDAWEDVGQLGAEREVMGMIVHNGKLYAGTLPLAEVHRYDGGTAWTKLARLDHTPDVTYRRAWTMAQYQGRLFVSTLPSGAIFSMSAGSCVTCDQSLPPSWRHVAAVRDRDRLRLYVDGKQAAESAPFEITSFRANVDAPLSIGAGAADGYRGRMRDVRIYSGALSPAEIERLLQ